MKRRSTLAKERGAWRQPSHGHSDGSISMLRRYRCNLAIAEYCVGQRTSSQVRVRRCLCGVELGADSSLCFEPSNSTLSGDWLCRQRQAHSACLELLFVAGDKQCYTSLLCAQMAQQIPGGFSRSLELLSETVQRAHSSGVPAAGRMSVPLVRRAQSRQRRQGGSVSDSSAECVATVVVRRVVAAGGREGKEQAGGVVGAWANELVLLSYCRDAVWRFRARAASRRR